MRTHRQLEAMGWEDRTRRDASRATNLYTNRYGVSDSDSDSSAVSCAHDDFVTRASLNFSQGAEGLSARCNKSPPEDRQ